MTATAWDVLDLAETDDVRSIKRAYAKALKHSRPEDDPVAFQRLTSAYDWALAYAYHCAREHAATAHGQDPAEQHSTEPAPATQGQAGAHPVSDGTAGEPTATGDGADGSQQGFEFNPFFEAMGEQIRKANPLHLKEWLEAHPDLYSIELKWALIPHVFDALARNAPSLDPHRGHLETLQAFFGVDATLRSHSAIAPAIDYLESKAWKEQPKPAPAAPMPAGWENLDEVMGSRRPPPRRQDHGSGVPWWTIVFGIWIALKIIAALATTA